jgi:hypothetical protein
LHLLGMHRHEAIPVWFSGHALPGGKLDEHPGAAPRIRIKIKTGIASQTMA